MLSKKIRFHGHGSLGFLYRNAETYRSRYFTVRAISNPRRNHSRFAVVVSKKVHKSAVGRNRIRRRIYEIVRHEIADQTTNKDVAIIVTNGEVLFAPHDELRQTLHDLLAQSGLFTQR